jgi:hypothetical protein
VNRKLHHVSASQITTFRSCKRLWALEKLAEIIRAKTTGGSLDIGSQVHEMLEDYLLLGSGPDAMHPHRTKFDAALPLLPPPVPRNPGLLVEYEFAFPVYPGGTPIIGGIDIALPPWLEEDGHGGKRIVAGVDDHKTTSDLKYAKTPEELKTNTQLIIYAFFLFNMPRLVDWNMVPFEAWRLVWEQGLDLVRIRHNYIKTRNVVRTGQATQVEVYLTWEDVAKEWAGIVEDVKEMEQLAESLWDNVHAIQNEPARIDYLIQLVEGDKTGARCHMFNGCDHKGRCPEASSLTVLTRGADAFKMEPEFDALFRNAPQMEEMKMENTTDDLAARLAAKMAAKKAAAPAAPAPTKEVVAPKEEVMTGGPTAAPTAAVLPPDAPSRETTEADVAPAAAPADTAPKARKGRAKRAAEQTPTTATPAVENAAQEAPQADPATPPPAPAAPVAEITGGVPIETVTATETPATSTLPCARLYINCRPLSGPDASADPFAYDRWIVKVLETIRTECSVPHYKLLKFGAGNGALAAVLGRLFCELPPVVCVDTMRPEAQEFLDIAIPRALVVVQAVR